MRYLVACLSVCFVVYSTQGCCIPDQWEGFIGEVGGVARRSLFKPPTLLLYNINISYDATRKKMATGTVVKRTTVKTIADYPAKKYYVITNATDCKYYPLNDPFQKGCTDNLTFAGSIVMGALNSSFVVNNWSFGYQGLGAYISTTAEGCIPVGEGFYGKEKRNYLVVSLGYYNITAGIKSPSIFTPPASCQPGTGDIDHHFNTLQLSHQMKYMATRRLETQAAPEADEKPKDEDDKYLRFENEFLKHLI